MGTVSKTITFTQNQESWIDTRVSLGNYGSPSEYINELVRKDQVEYMSKNPVEHCNDEKLAKLIQEGLDSGVSNRSVREIMEGVEARLKANGEL